MEWLLIGLAVVAGFLVWRIAFAGDVPKVGDDAPGFSLKDQNGKARALADFRGKWLALYFYPRDDTPGCTAQACAFRDDLHQLEAMGAQVVGVSVDDVASHVAFAKKFGLPFPLLADTTGGVAARYGSVYNLGIIKFAKRKTFLIDPQGRVAMVYRSANASMNSQEIMEDLARLQRT